MATVISFCLIHVYSNICSMFLKSGSLIFQSNYCWLLLLLSKKLADGRWKRTDGWVININVVPAWSISVSSDLWYLTLYLNLVWFPTQTDKSHSQNMAEDWRTTGFWRRHSWPHVRVVSVIGLWMMGPVLISFHSSVLCCPFFPFYLPEISDKTSVSAHFSGTLFLLLHANLSLHLCGLRHSFPRS